MTFLRHLLRLLLFSALAGAVWTAYQPAVVTLAGLTEADERAPLGVVEQVSQAVIKRSAPLQITEGRLNAHLAGVLRSRVGDEKMAAWLKLEPLRIDLRAGRAVLWLRWTAAGRPLLDAQVAVAVRREGEAFVAEILDGAYGRLRVPRALLKPLKPLLADLGGTLRPEIEALFDMNQIEIAEDRLLLDPRFSEVAGAAVKSP